MLGASIGAFEPNRLKDIIKKHQIHGGTLASFKRYITPGAKRSKVSCQIRPNLKLWLHTALGMQINSGHKYYEE